MRIGDTGANITQVRIPGSVVPEASKVLPAVLPTLELSKDAGKPPPSFTIPAKGLKTNRVIINRQRNMRVLSSRPR